MRDGLIGYYNVIIQFGFRRWGIPDEQVDANATEALCLHEIEQCFKVSAGPAFVSFLGDKYGYRPLPTTIPQPQFDQLRGAIDPSQTRDLKLLDQFYRLDTNAVPPAYILLNHVTADMTPLERNAANKRWNDDIFPTLQRLLWGAAAEVLGPDTAAKFSSSITQKEIELAIKLDGMRDGPKRVFSFQ
ncbi:hypothetical protein HK104_007392 [Borealophlyctis nickersoniae]|nr:hypothetical protein HK104_007392 [Borealophlyctis nickersoniae]